MKSWLRSLTVGLGIISIPALRVGWIAYNEAQQRERSAAAVERLKDAAEQYHSPAIETLLAGKSASTPEATTPSSSESVETPVATQTTDDTFTQKQETPVEIPSKRFDFATWVANENFRRLQQQKTDAAEQQRFDDSLAQQRRDQLQFQANLAEQTRKHKEFEADLAHSAAQNAEWQSMNDRSIEQQRAAASAQQTAVETRRQADAARQRASEANHKY